MQLPSQVYLKECFDYAPDTGALTWLVRPLHHFKNQKAMTCWNTRYAGKPAFTGIGKAGYYHGSINKKTYTAHAVIWKWLYGTEPAFIDHDDHNRLNNRKLNLKETTRIGNQRNMSKPSNNTSGFVGVGLHEPTGKWRAYLGTKYLGLFETMEEAVAVRTAAMKEHNYHINHGK